MGEHLQRWTEFRPWVLPQEVPWRFGLHLYFYSQGANYLACTGGKVRLLRHTGVAIAEPCRQLESQKGVGQGRAPEKLI